MIQVCGRINTLLDSGVVEYHFYSASPRNIQLGLRPRRIFLVSSEYYTVNRWGDGRLSLLFRRDKWYPTRRSRVGYHLERLNKSDNRPSPNRLTVLSASQRNILKSDHLELMKKNYFFEKSLVKKYGQKCGLWRPSSDKNFQKKIKIRF